MGGMQLEISCFAFSHPFNKDRKQLDGLHLNGFPFHPHRETFLVATVLTAVSVALINCAALVLPTGVGKVLPDRPLEEALTALATVDPVMLARGPISADAAQVFG